MLERLRSAYFYFCWLPPAIYLASDFYIGTSTGWGQWAMGVVVLPPMLLSAAFLLTGIIVVMNDVQKKASVWRLVLSTLVAGSVFIVFVTRSLWLSL